mgnify:CR=1 FL=1
MSLSGAYDPANIFAKILRGEAPCVRVHDDAEALVMMDIFPQAPGHCLVVPRAVEARNLLDLPPERVGGLFETVQRTAQAVSRALKPDGVIVTQFNGAPAGQTVFHLHVHVIPRFGDAPLQRHAAGSPADLEVLREQAARIKAAWE